MGPKNHDDAAIRRSKHFDDKCVHLDTIPQRDRRTDGQKRYTNIALSACWRPKMMSNYLFFAKLVCAWLDVSVLEFQAINLTIRDTRSLTWTGLSCMTTANLPWNINRKSQTDDNVSICAQSTKSTPLKIFPSASVPSLSCQIWQFYMSSTAGLHCV